jgi:hypothetical protein
MRAPLANTLALFLSVGAAVAGSEGPTTIVFCAPGYPGSTEQAQEVMDEFAGTVAARAGSAAGDLRAVYHETLDGGLEALRADAAAVAIVNLPFYLRYRESLGLEPLLAVEPASGATEQWSLVARKGAVDGPSALDGWKVAGMAGFAPRFVDRIALADWGPLPKGAEVVFASRVLSELRKASRGEPVAVLLDRAQAGALPSLPFADTLEVVARSRPHVASVVCAVGGRLGDARRAALVEALERLDSDPAAKEVLETMRIARFGAVPSESLRELEQVYDADGAR